MQNTDTSELFAGLVGVLGGLQRWLVSVEPEEYLGANVRPSFSLTVGSPSVGDNPACSVHLSYLPPDSEGAKKAKETAGAATYAQSVVLILSFTVKEDVDVFSLGELSATFKNIVPKKWFTSRSKVSSLGDGSKVYDLILTVLPAPVFPAVTEIFTHYHPTQLDVKLSLSQSPKQKETDFIEAQLSGSATLSRQFDSLISQTLRAGDSNPAFGRLLSLLQGLKGLNFELEFDGLSEFYAAALPEVPEDLKILNWTSISKLLVQPMASLHFMDGATDPAVNAIIIGFIKKVQEYLNGIHAVTLLAGDDIIRMECANLDLVHLLPSQEEVLSKKAAIEAINEQQRKKREIEQKFNEMKLVVMGEVGVGKSALTVQFVQGIFVECYDPTIEDSYRKYAMVDGQQMMFEILDTCGYNEYTAMRDLYMRNADAFMLVYSIANANTVKYISDAIENASRVKDVNPKDLNVLIVGNKSDLESEREVPTDEGQAIADKYGFLFLETSAKTRVNIDHAFESVARLYRQKGVAQLSGGL